MCIMRPDPFPTLEETSPSALRHSGCDGAPGQVWTNGKRDGRGILIRVSSPDQSPVVCQPSERGDVTKIFQRDA